MEVRVLDLGSQRLRVMAYLRPRLGVSPSDVRQLCDSGSPVVMQDLGSHSAHRITAELRQMGAQVQMAVCTCGCSDGPDHFP